MAANWLLADVLGSVAFTPVKSDMLGNVKVCLPRIIEGWGLMSGQKIRDRQLAAPLESESLQELVLNELKTKKHTATEGLVWLVRYVSPSSSNLCTSFLSSPLPNPDNYFPLFSKKKLTLPTEA